MSILPTCRAYLVLMRMDKPVGTVLLLWPTWWALWLASQGTPPLAILTWMTLGIVVMRSLGCVINDCCDYRYDRFVKRTCHRPLAQNQLSLRQAWFCALVLALFALWIVLQLNFLVFQLSLIGLALTFFYPLTKRFFACPQLVLGLTFAWGIPMAYAAILETIPLQAWYLYGLAALWILIYDTEYAMVDLEDDLKIGVYSSARLFGSYDGVILYGLVTLLSFLWLAFAWFFSFPLRFYMIWLVMSFTLFWQVRLAASRDSKDCFKAFLSNQWWGGLVWLALLVSIK